MTSLLELAQQQGIKPAGASGAKTSASMTPPAPLGPPIPAKATGTPVGTSLPASHQGAVNFINTGKASFPQSDPTHQSFMDQVGQNLGNSFVQRGKDQIAETTGAAQDIQNEMNSGDGTIVKPAKIAGRLAETGLRTAGNVAGGALDFFGAILKPAIEKIADHISNDPRVQKAASGKAGDAVTNTVNKAQQAYQTWSQQHPDAAKNLEATMNIGGVLLANQPGKLNPKLEDTVGNLVDKTANVVNKVKSTASDVVGKVNATLDASASQADTQALAKNLTKIQDTISPKLTPKETKLALQQGRLVEGQDPGLLKNGTPDQVLPSDRVVKASQTVNTNIPDAAKLKPSELYAKIDSKVKEIATNLQPEMKATPISEATKAKVSSNWEALKAQQNSDPYISNNTNITKLQSNFENNFLNKTGVGSMDDYWTTAKAYDASVPANVKNATSLSSEVLQEQKAVWLQNRAILRTALTDTATSLGEQSKQAFSNMHDLYDAQTNLLSKVKVGTPEGNKIIQWIKANPGKAAVGAYVGNKALRGAGLPSIPLP